MGKLPHPQLGLRFGLSDVPRRFAFTLDWKVNPGDTVNPQGMQIARGLPEVASSKDLSRETSQEPFTDLHRRLLEILKRHTLGGLQYCSVHMRPRVVGPRPLSAGPFMSGLLVLGRWSCPLQRR